MLKLSLILSAFFLIGLLADCPTSYPYSPKSGVYSGGNWEFWCNDWKLAQPGNGVINFRATGNDIYVGLFDTTNTQTFKYALIISGWGNAQIQIFKNGSFGSGYGSTNFQVPFLDAANSWSVIFSKSAQSVTVLFNGNTVFSYVDSGYASQAGNAQYISFSQYSTNVALYQDCPTYPYSPRNGVMGGASWEYYCSQWKLPVNGSGIVNFQAKGNDMYIGLFDSVSNKTFKYAIIYGGWGNIGLAVYKNGDLSTQYLTMKVTEDVINFNNYSIGYSASKSALAMYLNGALVFAFGDTKYNALNASFISFSQYSSNVLIQNVNSGSVCGVSSFMENEHYAKHMSLFAQMNGGCAEENRNNEEQKKDSLLVQNNNKK
jgi:hypothetical protein